LKAAPWTWTFSYPEKSDDDGIDVAFAEIGGAGGDGGGDGSSMLWRVGSMKATWARGSRTTVRRYGWDSRVPRVVKKVGMNDKSRGLHGKVELESYCC
jgi:hypothetical protein